MYDRNDNNKYEIKIIRIIMYSTQWLDLKLQLYRLMHEAYLLNAKLSVQKFLHASVTFSFLTCFDLIENAHREICI